MANVQFVSAIFCSVLSHHHQYNSHQVLFKNAYRSTRNDEKLSKNNSLNVQKLKILPTHIIVP